MRETRTSGSAGGPGRATARAYPTAGSAPQCFVVGTGNGNGNEPGGRGNPQPATRNPEPGTRNPEPATRNPEPGTRTHRPETGRKPARIRSPVTCLVSLPRYDAFMSRVVTGLEVLLESPAPIGGRPWALLANQASVTAELEPARGALRRALAGPLVRLFAPEHGLDGVAQDMEAVGDARDPLTGVVVRSLYGSDAATLEPRPEDLDGVGVVVVDVPDIGCRYYTFAATMDAVMAACERAGVEVVVLDRPNPIGGLTREGGPVEEGFSSFVSRLPTPIRHGVTLGELALLLQRGRYPALELTIITCRGWRRSMWWDSTGLPWVPPSPNMPTLETAAIYPGLCLVEATELSEGRGTTRPFHLVGAPGLDAEALVARLRHEASAGVAFRAAAFRPAFGKHAGETCSGVEIHIVDRSALRPVALGLTLLQAVRSVDPDRFTWRRDPYEFVGEVPAIDLLTGSAAARGLIEEGRSLAPLIDEWQRSVVAFEESLAGILLYHDD